MYFFVRDDVKKEKIESRIFHRGHLFNNFKAIDGERVARPPPEWFNFSFTLNNGEAYSMKPGRGIKNGNKIEHSREVRGKLILVPASQKTLTLSVNGPRNNIVLGECPLCRLRCRKKDYVSRHVSKTCEQLGRTRGEWCEPCKSPCACYCYTKLTPAQLAFHDESKITDLKVTNHIFVLHFRSDGTIQLAEESMASHGERLAPASMEGERSKSKEFTIEVLWLHRCCFVLQIKYCCIHLVLASAILSVS